jgi:hypothetical protein
MVERPIKKSERQSKSNADNNLDNLDSNPPIESNRKSSQRRDERSSSRGKKGSSMKEKESVQQINPALARGPKPVKPQPNVITEPETEETNSESSVEPESETVAE